MGNPFGLLLPFMGFDGLLNFPFYGVKIEARRRLHWGILDGRLRQSGDLLLNNHEPPKFAAHEIIHVTSTGIVQALTAD